MVGSAAASHRTTVVIELLEAWENRLTEEVSHPRR